MALSRIFVVQRRYISQVRVRFAPSPTGQLHLGGLRTAFYNFLFARSNNGRFVLRVEDTDQKRLVPGVIEKLESVLRWAGLTVDEGPSTGGPYAPYIQSQRLSHYQSALETLLSNGTAYRCFCSEQRLTLLRNTADGLRGYDNRCSNLGQQEIRDHIAAGTPFNVRFRMRPAPNSFTDMVFGHYEPKSTDEGDFVIMKSDGFPTYHFANVVDDHHMRISHVLRGEEWLASTIKHLQLYEAFSWDPPRFAHLPVLLAADGTKLSKRKGDVFVETFKDKGIYALPMINFLSTYGGSFCGVPTDPPYVLHTMQQLIDAFDLSRTHRHGTKIDMGRLEVFNRLYLTEMLKTDVSALDLPSVFSHSDLPFDKATDLSYIQRVLAYALKDQRVSTIRDLISEEFAYVWKMPQVTAKDLPLPADVMTQLLSSIVEQLTPAEAWSKDKLLAIFKQAAKHYNVKYGDVMHAIRIVLIGKPQGPPVAEIVELLGRKESYARIKHAIGAISGMCNQ